MGPPGSMATSAGCAPGERASAIQRADLEFDPELQSPVRRRQRREPRLLAYAKRHSRVPTRNVRNLLLFSLLLAIGGVIVLGLVLGNAMLIAGGSLLLCSWCWCPYCAIDRDALPVVEEDAPLIGDTDGGEAGGDDAGDGRQLHARD